MNTALEMVPDFIAHEVLTFAEELRVRREFVHVYGRERGLFEWGAIYRASYLEAAAAVAGRVATIDPCHVPLYRAALREAVS